MMGVDDPNHVFVSYVREDSDRVDRLCDVLEAAEIPYWRDRTSLAPGDAWKQQIRDAIRDGSLVFLACFSNDSRARRKSHMNEEVTLAVEEYRKMPPGRTWLIPVRFDDGDIPEWDLGAGRTMNDLNYVDLFGAAYPAQAAALVTTIHRVIGERRPSPATALAAVEQAVDADRAALLKRLTKDLVVDPARRIELDDLVSQEVQRVIAALSDSQRFPTDSLPRTNNEQTVALVGLAQDLWSLSEPFCQSLQVAARWASPDALTPWTSGLRTFVKTAVNREGGLTALLDLRHIPPIAAMTTAALACTSAGRWDNLKRLAVDPTVRVRHGDESLALVEATGPYDAFGNAGLAAHVLARAVVRGVDPHTALSDFEQGTVGKYHTPVAEWLHAALRTVFSDQMPDQEMYDAEFDRAEVMLGLLSQDAAQQRQLLLNPESPWRARSRWYGRSTWRSQHSHGNPVVDFDREMQSQGELWPPLQQNLFGGDKSRARDALDAYAQDFNQLARNRF